MRIERYVDDGAVWYMISGRESDNELATWLEQSGAEKLEAPVWKLHGHELVIEPLYSGTADRNDIRVPHDAPIECLAFIERECERLATNARAIRDQLNSEDGLTPRPEKYNPWAGY